MTPAPPSRRRSTIKRSARDTAGARMSNAPATSFCLSLFREERTAATSSCAHKEHIVARRHGSLVRSGAELLPDEGILCATAWMHGVFGAQLTIGNTSFHKLFSVSRDPYNITRASGLRMLMETKDGWRLLTVPSAFEMGLNDCRWVYQLDQRTVTVSATVSRRRAGHAVARRGRRAKMPLPCLWPSCAWRAGIWACRSYRDRLEAKALHFPAGSQ